MRRRDFIGLAGAATLDFLVPAYAQTKPNLPLIGVLIPGYEDVRAGVPRKELEQALATGRGGDDRWHVRKDGTRCWASGVVTPLKDDGGTLRGWFD